jgi:hypothetical protein
VVNRLAILWAACAACGAAQAVPSPLDADSASDPALRPESATLVERLGDPDLTDDARIRLAGRLLGSPGLRLDLITRLLDEASPASVRIAMLRAIAAHPAALPTPADAAADLELRGAIEAVLVDAEGDEMFGAAAEALAAVDPRSAATAIAAGLGLEQPTSRRRVAARVLGGVRDVETVRVLRPLLDGQDPLEPAVIAAFQTLAADPAVEGTADAWARWADDLLSAPAAVGRARLAAGADRAARSARQAELDATQALRRLAREQFVAASPEARDVLLLQYLRDRSSALRGEGMRLVLDAVTLGGARVSESAAAQVRELISDPSPPVRELAARVVRARSDESALEALLAQIAVERDPTARLSQVEALVPLRRPEAVPVLLDLAAGPSPDPLRFRAARVAADLAEASQDPAVAGETSRRLRALHAAGDAATRSAVLQALSRLSTPDLALFYLDLLARPRRGPQAQSAVDRSLVLRGVEMLGDANLLGAVTPSLSDPSPRVRESAVAAVAATGGFEQARQLSRYFDPQFESDERVRQAAWEAFVSTLPDAQDRQLAAWPDRLDDPVRKIVILRELADRARLRADDAALADRQVQIADLLLAMPDSMLQAARLYEAALDQALGAPDRPAAPAVVIVTRLRAALSAYARAGRIDDVSRLGQSLIDQRPELRQDVGAAIKREAERMAGVGNQAGARELLEATLAWPSPLDEASRRNLRDLLDTLPGGPD